MEEKKGVNLGRGLKYAAVACLAVVGVVFIAGNVFGPRTYGDIASNTESDCLSRIERDGWVPGKNATQMTPETYCKAKGIAAAWKAQCRDHEEAC